MKELRQSELHRVDLVTQGDPGSTIVDHSRQRAHAPARVAPPHWQVIHRRNLTRIRPLTAWRRVQRYDRDRPQVATRLENTAEVWTRRGRVLALPDWRGWLLIEDGWPLLVSEADFERFYEAIP